MSLAAPLSSEVKLLLAFPQTVSVKTHQTLVRDLANHVVAHLLPLPPESLKALRRRGSSLPDISTYVQIVLHAVMIHLEKELRLQLSTVFVMLVYIARARRAGCDLSSHRMFAGALMMAIKLNEETTCRLVNFNHLAGNWLSLKELSAVEAEVLAVLLEGEGLAVTPIELGRAVERFIVTNRDASWRSVLKEQLASLPPSSNTSTRFPTQSLICTEHSPLLPSHNTAAALLSSPNSNLPYHPSQPPASPPLVPISLRSSSCPPPLLLPLLSPSRPSHEFNFRDTLDQGHDGRTRRWIEEVRTAQGDKSMLEGEFSPKSFDCVSQSSFDEIATDVAEGQERLLGGEYSHVRWPRVIGDVWVSVSGLLCMSGCLMGREGAARVVAMKGRVE